MQNPLCKYSNLFGIPGKGMHSFRIFDIAVWDVFVVIIFGFIISRITKFHIKYVLPALFLLGIIVHRLFCVRTTVDRWLFP